MLFWTSSMKALVWRTYENMNFAVTHKKLQVIPLRRTFCTVSMAKLLIVEGNIAAGKSTLSKRLAEYFNYKVYDEPAPKNPYLAKFYKNPLKYSLKLQLWLFQQRFEMYLDAMKHILETGQGVIMDRSVYSDLVFTNVVFNEGKMSRKGYEYYLKVRMNGMKEVSFPSAIVYLDVPPSVCKQRIAKRGRVYEQSIPIEYLEHLSLEHDRVLKSLSIERSCPYLKYDWTQFGFGKEEPNIDDEMQLYVTGLNKIVADINSLCSSSWVPSIPKRFQKILQDSKLIEEELRVEGYDDIKSELPDE